MITRAPTGSRVRRGGRTRAGCPYPYPVGRRTQAAPGGLFHNTLRFRGVVPGKTGRCHTGLVTRPITPVWRPGRRETNRPRGGPGAGHVSGTSPLMPASHAVGCARPRARPSAVVRRTRRRGGAGRGLTGCARPRGPAASRLTATRAPRATPMCRSIRASAHAICTPAATLSVGSTTGSPRHPEHGCILDVSYAAARQLELVEDGVVPIEITVVVWEPSREIGHRAAAAGPVDDETGA